MRRAGLCRKRGPRFRPARSARRGVLAPRGILWRARSPSLPSSLALSLSVSLHSRYFPELPLNANLFSPEGRSLLVRALASGLIRILGLPSARDPLPRQSVRARSSSNLVFCVLLNFCLEFHLFFDLLSTKRDATCARARARVHFTVSSYPWMSTSLCASRRHDL